ncbi:histidine phosphatase family protein [Neobacillus dielmonensis]|uniref:histidine phosphatase family protein n=1 Tax=Neobacillus dielmonensis TaxID=1347369 RepID=UPI0005A7BE04|nr:histidine phosphatase family protein [Neobacillus dielmonensis]
MDDRVVIALFRHGLTEANKRKAYLGWSNSPLYEEDQLFSTKEYESYFCSDLDRCVLTAQRLFHGPDFHIMKELREMNFGDWEGKTYEELKEAESYRRWLSNPFHKGPPNGESFGQFTARVNVGWNRIVTEVMDQNLQSCALVTHGGVIKYLLSAFAPVEREFWSWNTPHHLGFELSFTRNSLRRGERCTLLQEVPLTANGPG